MLLGRAPCKADGLVADLCSYALDWTGLDWTGLDWRASCDGDGGLKTRG